MKRSLKGEYSEDEISVNPTLKLLRPLPHSGTGTACPLADSDARLVIQCLICLLSVLVWEFGKIKIVPSSQSLASFKNEDLGGRNEQSDLKTRCGGLCSRESFAAACDPVPGRVQEAVLPGKEGAEGT